MSQTEQTVILSSSANKTTSVYHTTRECKQVAMMKNPMDKPMRVAEWKELDKCQHCKKLDESA